ncbi:phenylalanine--tRNA ligase subunit beta [Salinisphaera orenii]|uniref:phenylalanine--tRNA ligase subunit beta n=1 Tax=Salinisphaera orenii TaxID=856731 RepID=UPI000DBE35ED
MKVSAHWLRRFVETDEPLDRIAERLTTAGLEVDEVEHWEATFDGVVVAQVVDVAARADLMDARVCTIEIDAQGTTREVVCAAPNVVADMRVPYATVGATLGDGRVIEHTQIGGIASAGMLCSAAELGLGADDTGLWRLPNDAPLGQDLGAYLGLPDDSLVLDLTPNRGDCLGMLGVAREVALVCGCQPPVHDVRPVAASDASERGVSISAPGACAVYCARVVTGVDVTVTPPPWLTERLRRAGIGAINAPVDITNYVMLACGQPMHAFDADRLAGAINVRYAEADESIVTLENEEVVLSPETLVIADDNGPTAIAGVIGGARTAVGPETRNIVFEAACFTPAAVAGQGRRYKIQTDSLHRFERGVDSAMAEPAIEYATALCQQIAGGSPGLVVRADGQNLGAYQPAIELDSTAIKRTLGQVIDPQFVTETLSALGLDVTQTGDDAWRVVPASWRFDLAIAPDLIEEIARIYGYERIATQPARVALGEPVNRLADPRPPLHVLRARGYSEAITYSFVDPELEAKLIGEQGALALDNPIAENMGVMRRTLWAGLLEAYLYNRRRGQNDIRLYEAGLCFEANDQAEHSVVQTARIGGLVAGNAQPQSWDAAPRGVDFFDAKGDVEALFAAAGRDDLSFEAAEHPGLQMGRCAHIRCNGVHVGWLGQLADGVIKDNKNKDKPYLFEVESAYLERAATIHHEPISDQPQVVRDLALVVADDVPAGDLIECARSVDASTLQSVDIVDVFYGGNLEAGFKSVALRLIFQDKTSTLTSEEVDQTITRIMSALTTTCGAYLRGA